MLWAASVALVRICEASSIASWASSTVTTALSGSLTVPVASACEALAALSWVCSSEEIASVSSPPKLARFAARARAARARLTAVGQAFRLAHRQSASQSADRRDDHLSNPRVEVNIDLAVCMAVTSDW